MKSKTKNIIHFSFIIFGISLSCVSLILTHYFVNKYIGVVSVSLGYTKNNHTDVTYEGVDTLYNKSSFNTHEEMLEFQKENSEKIAEEGYVLLEKGNIPYKKDTKVSLFSKSSVDYIFGGSGSGSASSKETLKDAFDKEDFIVNDALWDFYSKGAGKKYHRGVGSIFYGDSDDYAINECPLDLILNNNNVVNSFNEFDTAIFVLSRTGGEGNDLARGMIDYVDTNLDQNKGKHKNPNEDKQKSYLELDTIELEIIDYLNTHFKDIVLLVNTNNPFELGWINDYEKISTVISCPGNGQYGLSALPKILNGTVTPSGHLVDTYSFDAFNSPAMMNMGDFEYLIDNKKIKNNKGDSSKDGYFYVNYLEGIYVGYRYYETRYEDTVLNQYNAKNKTKNERRNDEDLYWKYENEVQYPFGYGLSTTTFSRDNYKVIENEDSFEISLNVKNTGKYNGKEVVEVYAQTPYGDYEKSNDIEKSSVQLVGFKKSSLLKPNEEEEINIQVKKSDLKSYDRKNLKSYYMSEGQYYLTVAKDAHQAVNNILRKKGIAENKLIKSPSEEVPGNQNLVYDSYVVSNLDTNKYKYDEVTGKEITNLFDFSDLSNYRGDVDYFTRKDYQSFPKTYGEISNIKSNHSARNNSLTNIIEGYEYVKNLTMDDKIYKMMTSNDSLNPIKEKDIDDLNRFNQKDNSLELIDLRGEDYNSPKWDKLLSKISPDEMSKLIQNAGYQTELIKSVKKPMTSDKDGPAGINSVAGHLPLGIAYPCATLISQTYNKDLAYKKGVSIGEDCLRNEISGWYGPANNIHRTPFGGRNFEYYSEDPYLSGETAKQEIEGASSKGIFVYLKHFAINNQEIHREKEGGLLTWLNEQAIREIYLKAFEKPIKESKTIIRYYEISTDDEFNPIKNDEGNYNFVEKTKNINGCLGIMTSFNRLGPVLASGSYSLITSLLKEEWGYHGSILTDYYHDWLMSTDQTVMAGGTLMLDPDKHYYKLDTNNKVLMHHAYESTKNTLYTVTNSSAMNGFIHGVEPKRPIAIYEFILISIDAVIGSIIVILAFVLIYKIIKIKKPQIIKK